MMVVTSISFSCLSFPSCPSFPFCLSRHHLLLLETWLSSSLVVSWQTKPKTARMGETNQ